MTEHVRSIDVGAVWDPNDPDAVLLARESRAVLALRARWDDADDRAVVLSWVDARLASIGPPNDEAINGHPLYEKGLRDVLWVGTVHDSELVAELERRNRVHPGHRRAGWKGLHHFVVRTKEKLIEVVAEAVSVERVPGSTVEAAVACLPSGD